MKRATGLFAVAAVLAISLALGACGSPVVPSSDGPGSIGNESRLGTIRLRIKDASGGRAILPPSDRRSAASYDISATGPGTPLSLSDIASSTVDLNDLAVGEWTVTVTGKNQYGQAILSGGTTAEVVYGTATPVTVSLAPISGQGTIAFTLSWPEAYVSIPTVEASIKRFGESDTLFAALSLGTISGGSVSYPQTACETGSWVVRLVLSSDAVPVATVVLSATVYPGLDSTQSYSLPSWEISHGPPAPTNLIAVSNSDTTVDLSWTDNSVTEAGFRVEISLDGSSWNPIGGDLPPNQTTFGIGGLSPDSFYYYRITAFNDFPGPGVSTQALERTRLRIDAAVTDPNLLLAIADTATGYSATWTYCDEPTIISGASRGIVSLSGIGRLVNVGSADLSSNSISDLSPLSGMAGLVTLDLHENAVSTIPSLTGLDSLTTLYLQAEASTVSDISGFSSLPTLTTLWIGDNMIFDISGLASLVNLVTLHMENNYYVTDFSALAGLTSLVSLYAPVNQVTDVSPLATATALEYINLQGNDIDSGVVSLISLSTATSGRLMYLDDNPRILPEDIQALRTVLEPAWSITWNEPGTAGVTLAVSDPQVSLSGKRATMSWNGDSMTVTADLTGGTADYYYWFLDGSLVDSGASANTYTVITSSDTWGRKHRLDVHVLTPAGIRGAYCVYAISD